MSDKTAVAKSTSQESIDPVEGAPAENGPLEEQAGAAQQARDIERVTDYSEDVEVDAARLGSVCAHQSISIHA